jgi:low temperature requirement protein LtrA
MSVSEPFRQDQRAGWAELFFDLVVVAGVGLLAHLLVADHSARAFGIFVVLFLAFWMSWTSFMLYANVRGERTHPIRLMVGIAGLGVINSRKIVSDNAHYVN